MNNNITKGDWHVGHDNEGQIEITTQGADGTLTIAYMTGEDDPEIDAQANAQLIASAPELLEALQDMVNACLNDTGSAEHEKVVALRKAKSAIQKATSPHAN